MPKVKRKAASPLGEFPGQIVAVITLTELTAHGWDLAQATRQRLPLETHLDAASGWILHSGSVEHLCLLHLIRARAARSGPAH